MVESSDAFDIASRVLAQVNMVYPSAVGFYNYGNTQNFLAWTVLRPMQLAGDEVTYATVTLVLVLWQLFFVLVAYAAIISLVLALKLRLGFSALLVTVPAASQGLFLWTYQIHPDILQFSLLMVLVVLFVRKEPNLFFSGLVWGLAIGTKWQSALFIVFVVSLFLSPKPNILRDRTFWKKWVSFFVAAGGAFSATNLSAFFELPEVIRDIRFESWHTWYGHGSRAEWAPLDWAPIFLRESLGLVALAPVLYFVARNFLKSFNREGLAMEDDFARRVGNAALITFTIGAIHLVLVINYREPRYFLYLVPLLILLASVSAGVSGKSNSHGLIVEIFALLSFPVFIFAAYLNLSSAQNRTAVFLEREQFEAATLISEACDPKAAVLLPMYSYLPEGFQNLVGESFWLFDQSDVEGASLVILNREVPGVHIWSGVGGAGETQLILGERDESAGQIAVFYELLSNPEKIGFTNLFDGHDVKAYVRSNSEDCSLKN